MRKNGPLLAYAALLSAMLVWGSSFIVLKIAFQSYDPLFVIFARMFLGLLCFAPFLWKQLPLIRREHVPLFLLMALFEPCLYFLFEAKALTLTTASQAGMITSLLPLMVGVTGIFYLKEKMTLPMIAGFSLAIGGVIWLTLAGSGAEEAPRPVLGNIMELLAMVCATGYTVVMKRLSERYSPLLMTGVQALTGSLFFLPLCLLPLNRFPAAWSFEGSLAVLYLGVIVTLGGYGCYNFGLSRLPANRCSAFINLIPVVALVLSILVLKEKVGLSQFAASALILGGVVISQLSPFRSFPKKTAPA